MKRAGWILRASSLLIPEHNYSMMDSSSREREFVPGGGGMALVWRGLAYNGTAEWENNSSNGAAQSGGNEPDDR